VSFTFENHVGRLVEISITGSMSEDEAQQFRTRMFLMLSGLPRRGMLVGDLRRCNMQRRCTPGWPRSSIPPSARAWSKPSRPDSSARQRRQ
jgi:hypothetical protein